MIVSDLLFFFVRVENRINASPQKHLLKLLAFLAHFTSEVLLLLCYHLDVFILFIFTAWSKGLVKAELILQILIVPAHNIVHLSDIFRSVLLLLSNSVIFKLFDELGLVILIDVRDLLCGQLIFGLTLDPPENYLVSI